MNYFGAKIGLKMSDNLVVVVDADAIIAQGDEKDPHHQKAAIISENLVRSGAQVLYPVTAIAEANAYTQRVLNSTAGAFGTAQFLTSASINVVEVNKQTLTHALNYFSPTTSKKNTLFDCIVMAVAEANNADAIFSFDKVYQKKGFKLASDL